MKKFQRQVIVLLIFVICDTQLLAQSKMPDFRNLIKTKINLSSYESELLDIDSTARISRNSDDVRISHNLMDIVSEVSDQVSYIVEMMALADKMICKADKNKVIANMRHSIDVMFLKLLTSYITSITNNLSNTKTPALTHLGTRLQKELMEFKELLR